MNKFIKTEKGYYYKFVNNKKIRISKDTYLKGGKPDPPFSLQLNNTELMNNLKSPENIKKEIINNIKEKNIIFNEKKKFFFNTTYEQIFNNLKKNNNEINWIDYTEDNQTGPRKRTKKGNENEENENEEKKMNSNYKPIQYRQSISEIKSLVNRKGPNRFKTFYFTSIGYRISKDESKFMKIYELSPTNKLEQILYITNEILFLQYAYFLNQIRSLTRNERNKNKKKMNLVKIPKLLEFKRKGNKIYIIMEYISPYKIDIPSSIKDKIYFFTEWNLIITDTLKYFRKNNLFHHDTGSRNIYFHKGSDDIIYLVIIDFGLSYFEKNNSKSQINGYLEKASNIPSNGKMNNKSSYYIWFYDWLKEKKTGPFESYF